MCLDVHRASGQLIEGDTPNNSFVCPIFVAGAFDITSRFPPREESFMHLLT
jgi:hypothetical protein